ncbi:putative arylamine N-acetyltransferase 2 [Orchesella cincta]|uniref:arylamine N-acetyltransferase n=1 Tax=Orchesella cincta TaxID=48709 RepID=A0A1D2NCU7_ORCCI|nr:putative arylamine N-acetyltransferase 2 [Orchesella cincta]
MLTSEEAESFLTNVLKFKNWREVLEGDKLEFLRVLVPYYAHNLYFHNVCMNIVPSAERRVPTAQDIVSAGLSGIGGACITQNTFLTYLLQAIGFNSYTVSGFVHGPRNTPDNHVICIVEFSPEEKYLLELGVALPFAEPVPMHKLPFTQTAAGFRYRYKKADDREGVFYRVQLDGALFGGEFEDKSTEYVRYEFTMKPQPVEFFQEPLVAVFIDVDTSIFLQHPFMFRYFEEDDSGNLVDEPNISGDRKWILIRGVSVLIGTDKGKEVKHYDNYDQVKPVILKHFPKFREEDVEKALECWNTSVVKYGYFKAR